MKEFVVSGARVFDGERSLGTVDVHVRGEVIAAVGGPVPEGVEVIDGRGSTLLPGLIDSHVHTSESTLRQALSFGVTTELDMTSMPAVMIPLRKIAADGRDLADVRSASVGLTPPNGHPHQLRRGQNDPAWPTATTPGEVAAFVDGRIAEGADYLKVMIEDGHVFGDTLPPIDQAVLNRLVEVAHDRGKLVLAHTLSLTATERALAAGADAVTHLFVDRPHTPEIVNRIADADMFVIPTLSTLGSITGQGFGARLVRDSVVRAVLDLKWLENLAGDFATYSRQNFEVALATLTALRAAGVDVLAGTDAAHLGARGMAHGVSLHDELRLLTLAGWSPSEALRAATALPARRFSLLDRGRIAAGKRADLLLVGGDPTRDIASTRSIQAVWRQGCPLESIASAPLK